MLTERLCAMRGLTLGFYAKIEREHYSEDDDERVPGVVVARKSFLPFSRAYILFSYTSSPFSMSFHDSSLDSHYFCVFSLSLLPADGGGSQENVSCHDSCFIRDSLSRVVENEQIKW